MIYGCYIIINFLINNDVINEYITHIYDDELTLLHLLAHKFINKAWEYDTISENDQDDNKKKKCSEELNEISDTLCSAIKNCDLQFIEKKDFSGETVLNLIENCTSSYKQSQNTETTVNLCLGQIKKELSLIKNKGLYSAQKVDIRSISSHILETQVGHLSISETPEVICII